MKNNISLIISREYSLRVKKKGFIITTLLFPVLMAVLMFLPAMLHGVGGSARPEITISDATDNIAPLMIRSGQLSYSVSDQPADSLIHDPDNYPLLVISADDHGEVAHVAYYCTEAPSLDLTILFNDDFDNALETLRLKEFGIENLDEIMAQVKSNVFIDTVVIGDDGSRQNNDAVTGMIVGMAMSFVLYMFLLIYGQIVMQSIIEEKNNRVLELIVSSVKPMQLMVGKIVGVGLVALTQVAIWGILICVFVKFGLPAVIGADTVANIQGIIAGTVDPASVDVNMQLVQVYGLISSLGYIINIFGYMMVYLAGGFMLYASIYAAIGAAVDNAQDASQLQIFATFPIIISMVLSMTIAQDPNSTMAQWLSVIPFTSPMVMMGRIPSGVDGGVLALSIVLLVATVVLTVWFAAKIYRVGIFMYGKKPSVKDLVRWARYK